MLKNMPLILHAIDSISSVADEIIVAARDEQQWQRGLELVPILTRSDKNKLSDAIILVFDSHSYSYSSGGKGIGILAGVLSGVKSVSSPYSLIIGCDMPFVNKYVTEFLFEIAERGNYDAVVPIWENGMIEPLHAVYKREQVFTAVKTAIKSGERRMSAVLSRLKNVNYIPVERLRGFEAELKTFRNINTPEELEKCAAISKSKIRISKLIRDT